jgi:hypothetical protein
MNPSAEAHAPIDVGEAKRAGEVRAQRSGEYVGRHQ